MKKVLITGVSGHLGSITATFLSSAGYEVWGVIKHGQKLEIPGVQWIHATLDDEEDVAKAVQRLKLTVEKIDLFIAMAGGFAMGNIEQTNRDTIEKMMTSNFSTTYSITRQIFLWMKEKGGGKIFLTSARPALEGGGEEAVAYTLSKSAILTLNQLLNDAGKASFIQSYAIVPGILDTPANRAAMPMADFSSWDQPDEIAKMIHKQSLISPSEKHNPIIKTY